MNYKQILVIALTILIVVIGLIVISIVSTPKPNQTKLLSTPTPVQVNGNIGTALTPTPIIPYTKTNDDNTFGKEIDNKPALNPADTTAKQNTITTIQQNPYAIYETEEYKIMYVQNYDMFQVEIKTTNVKQAENDVLTWFATKGLSKDAVCKIPVQFYLNFYVKQQVQQDIPPLFYGC